MSVLMENLVKGGHSDGNIYISAEGCYENDFGVYCPCPQPYIALGLFFFFYEI